MKLISTTKINRKWDNWQFRAISARVFDDGKLKDVVFGISNSKDGESAGLEIYQGDNYIVGSNDTSRSWRYDVTKIPKKWNELFEQLLSQWMTCKWSEVEVNKH